MGRNYRNSTKDLNRNYGGVKIPQMEYKPPAFSTEDITVEGMLDTKNPNSLISLVSPNVREAMLKIPGDYWVWNERELRNNVEPSPEDTRVRMQLWDGFNRAIADDTGGINMGEVVRGACSVAYFTRRILTDPLKLVYICTPPADYVVLFREMHYQATQIMQDVLMMKPIKKKKVTYTSKDPSVPDKVVETEEIDGRVLQVQQKIWKEMQDRVMGTLVQKMAIQQQNMNYDMTRIADNLSPDEITKKLNERQNELLLLQGKPIEVEKEPVYDEVQTTVLVNPLETLESEQAKRQEPLK